MRHKTGREPFASLLQKQSSVELPSVDLWAGLEKMAKKNRVDNYGFRKREVMGLIYIFN